MNTKPQKTHRVGTWFVEKSPQGRYLLRKMTVAGPLTHDIFVTRGAAEEMKSYIVNKEKKHKKNL